MGVVMCLPPVYKKKISLTHLAMKSFGVCFVSFAFILKTSPGLQPQLHHYKINSCGVKATCVNLQSVQSRPDVLTLHRTTSTGEMHFDNEGFLPPCEPHTVSQHQGELVCVLC